MLAGKTSYYDLPARGYVGHGAMIAAIRAMQSASPVCWSATKARSRVNRPTPLGVSPGVHRLRLNDMVKPCATTNLVLELGIGKQGAQVSIALRTRAKKLSPTIGTRV